MHPSLRRTVLVLLCGAGLAPAAAADPEPFARGRQELALSLGWGRATSLGGGRGDVDSVEFVDVRPRWGLGLTDPRGHPEAWYRGNLELLAEGELLFLTAPHGGFASGASLLLRWNFLTGGRLVPFLDVGAGAVYLDFDIAGQQDGLNFTPQAGLGLHVLLSQRAAVGAAWRFHHISNAGIDRPNLGINSSLVQLGVSWFLR